MFGQCYRASASHSSIWEKQKHTNAIVKAKMGKDGVLAEYLQTKIIIGEKI